MVGALLIFVLASSLVIKFVERNTESEDGQNTINKMGKNGIVRGCLKRAPSFFIHSGVNIGKRV